MNHEDHEHRNHKGHKEHKDANHDGHQEHEEPNEHKKYNERGDPHERRNDHLDPEPIASEVERVIREVIGAAIDVHRELGPGFIEPVYQRALIIALRHRRLCVDEQMPIDIRYRGELVCRHRLDLVVEGVVVIEVKAVRKLRPLHQAQILSYLKASRCRVGLLMNFNVPMLVDGLRRFVR